MKEEWFRQNLENDSTITSPRAIKTRIIGARKIERIVNADIDYIVSDNEIMTKALDKLDNYKTEGYLKLQNVLRTYYKYAHEGKPFSKEMPKPVKSKINVPLIIKSKIKILFVSNKNVCRSMIAEYIMKYMIHQVGLMKNVVIDSAGCNVNTESIMDMGAVKELHRHQIPVIRKNPVQVNQADFDEYDYIICMNLNQIKYLTKMRAYKNIFLLLDFIGEHHNISDPGFNRSYSSAYNIIYKGCEGLLKHLQKGFEQVKLSESKKAVKTKVTFDIDEELLKRFEYALVIKNETLETAIEKSLDYYISNSTTIEDFISKCAARTEQINYRIFKAYYKSIELEGKATYDKMKSLCSSLKEYPGMYIYQSDGFDEHYKQMKTDNKIFFEDRNEVKVLPEVEAILTKYKSKFIMRN